MAELESAGVGRPSTYANTLKTLLDRGYALIEGRVFVVTPLGRLVCGRLCRHFPKVTDVGFTASLEKSLDQVAAGSAGMYALLDAFYGELKTELAGAEGDQEFVAPKPTLVDWPCPSCGAGCAVLLERGKLVVACRTCPDPVDLAWARRRRRAGGRRVPSRMRRRLRISACRRVVPSAEASSSGGSCRLEAICTCARIGLRVRVL